MTLNLLRLVAEKVGPPRALHVPFDHGYPLGEPGNPDLQRAVLDAALRVLERRDEAGPVLLDLADMAPELQLPT